jgi:hypothetical protein
MLTALFSAITGLISGIVPDVLKEVRESRAASREMEFLRLNHQLTLERAKLEVGAKLEESYEQRMMAEIAATKEQIVAIVSAQAQPTGIAWIDGFNALIRPFTAMMFVMMFAIGLCGYSFGLTHNDAFGAAMTGMFSEAILATLGFIFGYRSVSGQKKATA